MTELFEPKTETTTDPQTILKPETKTETITGTEAILKQEIEDISEPSCQQCMEIIKKQCKNIEDMIKNEDKKQNLKFPTSEFPKLNYK